MQSDISPAQFDAIKHDSASPSSPGVAESDKEKEKSLQSYQKTDKSEVAVAECGSVCDTSVVSCGEAEFVIISESDEEQINSEIPDTTNSEFASDVISKSENNIERLQNDLSSKLNPETNSTYIVQLETINSPRLISDERVTQCSLPQRASINNRLKIAFWNSEPAIAHKDYFNDSIVCKPLSSVRNFHGSKSSATNCEVLGDKNIENTKDNYKSNSEQHIKTSKIECKLSDEQIRTVNILEKNFINKSNFEKSSSATDNFFSVSSPDLKRFDDNNNKVFNLGNHKIGKTGKRDGYAEFVRKLSLDRYADEDIDYSVDIGRAAASQLLSSDSEDSVDDDLISNFRQEVFSLSNLNITLPRVSNRNSVIFSGDTVQESRNSRVQQSLRIGDTKLSTSPASYDNKTAPIIESPAEKKKLGGIRRLLSPNLFSNDSRRKASIDQGCGKHPDHAETKSKTLLETAFVGDVSKKQRSKSVSPNRNVNDDKNQVRYGIPKRKSDEIRQCCRDNSVKCNPVGQSYGGDRPELGLLQVDTENKRDSVASSTSSTSTLVSPEEKNTLWVKDTIKTQSLPQHYQSVRSKIPLNQSGRLSAPPYINYYSSPYKHETLLMPVSAQMKITSPPQYHNIKAKYLQNYDFLYKNQSSSVESSPGSQNSPQSYEIRNFDHAIGPNVSLVKPQPVYNRGIHNRPRSVSPATGRMGNFVTPENYFVRGSNQRHTISGSVRQRQSTIYEEVQDDKEMKLDEMKYKKNSNVELSTSVGGKRVSFSPNYEHDINSDNVYWPTRKGLAPEPPTRQSAKQENESYMHQADADYVNISDIKNVTEEAPNRPLPPVPKRTMLKQNSVGYGVIGRNVSRSLNQSLSDSAALRKVNQPTTPRVQALSNRWQQQSDTESGSEAGEIQRILQDDDSYRFQAEEEWAGGEGKGGRSTGNAEQSSGTAPTREEDNRRGRGRRDDPRRHTLSGDHHHNYPSALARSMDLEMGSKSQRRKSPLPRGYPPPSTAMLFDEDPGIMSEVETSSTGFRRGGKQRSSLPVVRTPSKTLERPLGSRRGDDSSLTSENHNSTLQADDTIVYNNIPLHCGLVFLQYRSETKRALLPNEITSIDTVKALFVRSFPKQLTMEYLDSPMVKIYIHDSSKDMFYELEDLRSHLRDIRDRSVLRLFESADVSGSGMSGGLVPPPTWDQDQSYFSEPEFDSEYQHQHIHKTKGSKSGHQPYYMTHSFPPGGGAPATLPRSGPLLRAFSPALPGASKPPSDRIHADAGYMSSPERGGGAPPRSYPPSYTASTTPYEDPYYSQYSSRTGSITPVIDEEASDTELIDESYSLYGVKLPVPRGQFPAPAIPSYDSTRIRVEHMERQLANLTGLVQKALTQAPTPTPREFLQVPPGSTSNYPNDDYDKHSSSSSASLPDESYHRPDSKPPKLGRDKSVSFEKSVSFSDEPPDMNSPKQHSPQHGVDTKPTKPAIKSSTLPRTSSQERDRHKPAPPPKPVSLSPGQYEGRHVYRDLQLTPEMYNQLRGLQKKAKDLRQEVRNLRRMSQAQAHTVRETIRDTFIKIRAMIMTGGEGIWSAGNDTERTRLNREEDLYKQEMIRLESDLTELESTVEELRGNVINRKTRVNMSDVENMALVLSKSSKTVADLKLRFPSLQESIRSLLNQEMEKVVCEEKFLKEEPERLESALRRCKKLTGTLVTLKRLASVQEQRLPEARISPTLDETPPVTPTSGKATGTGDVMGQSGSGSSTTSGRSDTSRPENALDALLDELQTFAKPPVLSGSSTLRRLHSYPSGEGGKPPVPERGADLLNKRVPPPPPPRTSSRSPLSSPTGPSVPPRGSPLKRNTPGRSSLKENTKDNPTLASNSSSCESVNSQEGMQHQHQQSRQELLEQRHQELLRKQRALQEQYTRLQQLQRAPPPDLLQLKKTGSESNLLAKMGLGLSAAVPISGSLSHLGPPATQNPVNPITTSSNITTTTANSTATFTTTTSTTTTTTTTTNIVTVTNTTPTTTITPPATTNKIYETDIL